MAEDPCPICLEDFDQSYTVIKCGHKFHIECFNLYVKNNNRRNLEITCPMCRGSIDEPIVLYTLYSHCIQPVYQCGFALLCCFLCF